MGNLAKVVFKKYKNADLHTIYGQMQSCEPEETRDEYAMEDIRIKILEPGIVGRKMTKSRK